MEQISRRGNALGMDWKLSLRNSEERDKNSQMDP
jgi:hypothetical protein